jgi:hypothetical protein
MSFITGFDRKQTALFPQAIDELIAPNNPIRFIDTFVDPLKIVEFGFKDVSKNVNGRPSADVGFIFLAYNLKRILNIIGIEELLALLRLYIDDISSLFTLKTYKKPNTWSLTYLSIFISSLQISAFNPYIHEKSTTKEVFRQTDVIANKCKDESQKKCNRFYQTNRLQRNIFFSC